MAESDNEQQTSEAGDQTQDMPIFVTKDPATEIRAKTVDGKTATWRDGSSYTGSWNQETKKLDGHGKMTFANKATYDGEWENGQMHGPKSILTDSEGNIYTGDFVEGEKEGHGEFKWKKKKNKYTGDFVKGKFDGHGEYSEFSKYEYRGDFKDNKMQGDGKIIYTHNRSSYEGKFKNDRFHGKGIFTYRNGVKFVGFWENGKQIDSGNIVDCKDEPIDSGNWVNGIKQEPFEPKLHRKLTLGSWGQELARYLNKCDFSHHYSKMLRSTRKKLLLPEKTDDEILYMRDKVRNVVLKSQSSMIDSTKIDFDCQVQKKQEQTLKDYVDQLPPSNIIDTIISIGRKQTGEVCWKKVGKSFLKEMSRKLAEDYFVSDSDSDEEIHDHHEETKKVAEKHVEYNKQAWFIAKKHVDFAQKQTGEVNWGDVTKSFLKEMSGKKNDDALVTDSVSDQEIANQHEETKKDTEKVAETVTENNN